MRLTPEQFAELVADKLRPELRVLLRDELQHVDREPGRRLTAEECAAHYQPRRSARWWREHAAEFGGERHGDGPKPRISFDPDEVERVLTQRRAA